MRKALKMLLTLVKCAVIAYVIAAALLWFFQDKVLFPASRDINRTPDSMGWTYEEIWLDTPFGRTHAWWVPKDNPRGTVLFSHGNAGNIADRLESIGLLRKLGFSVLAYDYGGYGLSEGEGPSEKRCRADVRAAWRHLTDTRGIPPEQILLFGRSLGGAVTADLAQEVRPGAVVLESTFLSVPDVAREKLWFLPVRALCSSPFNSKDKVGRITAPVLVVHSPDDTLIPYRNGKGLYERITAPKQFLEIRGDHNDGFVLSMEKYLAGWEEFLQKHFLQEVATSAAGRPPRDDR